MDTDPRPRRFGRTETRTALTGLAALLLLGITEPAYGQEAGAAPAAADNEAPLDLSMARTPMRAAENSEWWRSGNGGYDAPTWDLMVRLAGPGESFASQQDIDVYRFRMARGEYNTGWYDSHASDYGGVQETETSGSVDRHKITVGIRIPTHERRQ